MLLSLPVCWRERNVQEFFPRAAISAMLRWGFYLFLETDWGAQGVIFLYSLKCKESLLSGHLSTLAKIEKSCQQLCSACVIGYSGTPRFPNSFSLYGSKCPNMSRNAVWWYCSRSLLWVKNCELFSH